MAADILLYHATACAGRRRPEAASRADARHRAEVQQRFREPIAEQGFDEAFFPLPEPLIPGPATRVMSLRDGTKKMSKSDASDMSRINLMDDADTIAQKIKRATTDPEPLPSEAKGLESAAGGRQSRRHLCGARRNAQSSRRARGIRRRTVVGTFKPALADLAVAKLAPIAGEMKRLVADPARSTVSSRRRRSRPRHRGAETWTTVKESSVSSASLPVATGAAGTTTMRRARVGGHERQAPTATRPVQARNSSSSSTTAPECDRAVTFAAHRVKRTGGTRGAAVASSTSRTASSNGSASRK